ncbi:hypothetical protein E2C01_051388 [Portunus trituberculatus]|uniref:Uncharacterized protein n=1 Tax=Portunus trituberculatus TaxID=210409 RepID=A0A5B7GIS3_PORTR|nr:hypothetical protein [Portunus trituberculatus]
MSSIIFHLTHTSRCSLCVSARLRCSVYVCVYTMRFQEEEEEEEEEEEVHEASEKQARRSNISFCSISSSLP